MPMTGSGKVIFSKMIGASGSQSVSPVVVFFKTDDRGNLAGIDLLHFFAIVRVHADDAADALLIILCRVQNI